MWSCTQSMSWIMIIVLKEYLPTEACDSALWNKIWEFCICMFVSPMLQECANVPYLQAEEEVLRTSTAIKIKACIWYMLIDKSEISGNFLIFDFKSLHFGIAEFEFWKHKLFPATVITLESFWPQYLFLDLLCWQIMLKSF